MIGYDDMLAQDAYSYFNRCWAFKIVDGGRRVIPYALDMDYPRYEEADEVLAHDTTYRAAAMASEDTEIAVTGEELFCTSDWITHRFAMGYVPVGRSGLARVDAEPVSSRMVKGLLFDHCRSVPLLVANANERTRRWYQYINRVRGSLNGVDLPKGIAKVLSMGTPPVMRSRVPLHEAHARSRRAVLEFMQDERKVVLVPEFKTALVKHRTRPGCAYILHNGTHIGMVYYDTGLHARMLNARSSGRKVADYIESTRRSVITNLLCDTVESCDSCL